MATVFVCARCGVEVTAEVNPTGEVPILGLQAQGGEPRVERGTFEVEKEDPDHGGWFVLHLEDLVGTQQHPDYGRWSGCCGPDGSGPKNTLCANSHEVGTEVSECYFPHFMWLDPEAVRATAREGT